MLIYAAKIDHTQGPVMPFFCWYSMLPPNPFVCGGAHFMGGKHFFVINKKTEKENDGTTMHQGQV